LTIHVTVTFAERSFSKLKLIKFYLIALAADTLKLVSFPKYKKNLKKIKNNNKINYKKPHVANHR
jgi:hypothetical protein